MFAKGVVMQSKRNLTQQGKKASSALHRSIKYELDVHKNSFSLAFLMENYGQFVDQGVKGKRSSSKAMIGALYFLPLIIFGQPSQVSTQTHPQHSIYI